MKDRLDRDSPIPLFVQIVEALRWMIANGVYARGEQLPPARLAAEQWGVNRHTVARAYRELIALGIGIRRSSTRSIEVVGAPVLKSINPGTDSSPRFAGTDPSLAAFLAEVVHESDRRFGLTPREIATMLVADAHDSTERPRVAVVECNEPMANDLASQIAARWAVDANGWVIGRGDDPPTGATVATMFHFAELRQAWPDRIGDVRFVSVRPTEEIREAVDARCSGQKRPTLTVMGDGSLEEARNQSADLRALFPEERYDFSLAVRREALPPTSSTENGAVLVTPLAWGNLSESERRRSDFIPVRYRIDSVDLETLGEVFGWEPGPLRRP